MGQPAVQQRLDAAALHSPFASLVARFPPTGQPLHQGVEQQAARTRLKSDQPPCPDFSWQPQDRGHASQMNQHPILAGLTEQQMFDHRRQRKALTAGNHVAVAELAQRRQPCPLGNDGRHAQRQRRGKTAIHVVPDEVPWTADAQDLRQGNLGAVRRQPGCVCQMFTQQTMSLPSLADRRGLIGDDLGEQSAGRRRTAA